MAKGIPVDDFKQEVRMILASAVGSDYASELVDDEGFLNDVKTDVEQASAWEEEGYYTDDDTRLAIGRVFLDWGKGRF